MRMLGIDPGMTGALSVVDCAPASRPRLVAVLDMPLVPPKQQRLRVAHVCAWIDRHDPEFAYIEDAYLMPGCDVGSGGRYMRLAGALEATILCCGVQLRTVSPVTWKNAFGLFRDKKTSRKHASRELAKATIDDLGECLEAAGNHDRAEAMLIAIYGAMMQRVNVKMACLGHQLGLAI